MHGPLEQATFLRRLGIETRAEALKKGAPLGKNAEVNNALVRQAAAEDATGMGKMFKAIAFGHPELGELPGFERSQAAGESKAAGSGRRA